MPPRNAAAQTFPCHDAGDDRCGGPLRRWRHAQPTQGGLDQFTRASS